MFNYSNNRYSLSKLVRSNLIKNILIVGLGSIGKRHLRLTRLLFPNANIKVFRHQASKEIPECSNGCFSQIDEVIAFSPEIAVIANPATFHIDTAQYLANLGVHLLIEKPLSSSLDGVTKLIETSQKLGTVLLTGYNLRFFPSLKHFRDLLKEDIIGKILSVRCEVGQYLPNWRPDSDYRKGVSARCELGGGVLLELSHELDYIRWIFGEVVWAKATLSQQSSLEIDVEDTAHLTLGIVTADETHQIIGTVNLDFIRHDTTRKCVAIGEKGSLYWNGLTGEVMLYRAEGKEWEELFRHQHKSDESYLAEWDHFLSCVTENKNPLITGEDGLKVLQIIEAARRSSESEEKVTVADML